MRLLIALALLAACEQRELPAPPPPHEPPPATKPSAKLEVAPEAPAGLPPACARYRRIILRLATCERLDASAKDAFVQAFRVMEQGWVHLETLPAGQLDKACQQGVDGLRFSVDSLCPDLLKVERE